MNASDLANIRNLTGLWRRMGASTLDLGGGLALQRSDAWPHRRWLEPGVRADAEQLRAAAAAVVSDAACVAPVWGGDSDPWAPALRAAGLAAGFELLAMQRPRDEGLPGGPGDAQLVDVTAEHGALDVFDQRLDGIQTGSFSFRT